MFIFTIGIPRLRSPSKSLKAEVPTLRARLANDNQQASILEAISAALHIRNGAKSYGVYVGIFLTIRRVVLHSHHYAKKLLPWCDGVLEANEQHFKEHGEAPPRTCLTCPRSVSTKH